MANYNGVIRLDVSWTKLKSVSSSKNLSIQYEESSSQYDIFCLDGSIAYVTLIFTGVVPDPVRYNQTQNDIDKTDFETNYKDIVTNKATSPSAATNGQLASTANPTLVAGSDGTNIRTLTSDSSGRLVSVGLGTAGTPLGGVVSIQGVSGGFALPISGSITATNASIAATGASPPASATYIGGSVTTAAPTYTTGQINALSLTTTGALRTDASGTTQPISGAVSQSGTWTVQPGNTANTTPWLATISQGGNSATVSAGGALKVDNSAVTQPVSGSITANIGTSGSLALDATVAKLTVAQSAALGSNTQALIGASVTTAAPTYTTGNINPLSLTTAGALRTDASGTTQPVSGSITANIGTSGSLALDATLTNRTQFTKLTDGTNNSTVKAASTAAVVGDTALVVAISPNNTVAVTGTVTATNPSVTTTGSAPPASATYIGGSVTTAAPTYTTGQMSGLSLTTTGLLRVDNSGVTQPVSGSITANIGTSGSLALDATVAKLTIAQSTALGSNTQALIGASVTTAAPTYTTGNINPLSLTTAGALRTDSSGTTQPVSGTIAATQSGTWTVQPGNTANTTPWLSTISQGGNSATVSVGGALKVDNSAVTQPVSGTITANIGTSGSLALDATVAKLTIAQSTALGSNTQALIGASVTTAAPTYTTGNINPLSLTTAGALRTDSSGTTQPVSGSGNFTVVQATASNLNARVQGADATGAAIAGNPILLGASDGTNLRTLKSFDLDSGGGIDYNLGVSLRKARSGGSVDFGTNLDPVVSYVPQYNQTLFGELRVAQQFGLFDMVNRYEIDARELDISTATGGTVVHVPNSASINLAVTGTNGSQAKLRTNTYFKYQAGRAQSIKISMFHADTGKTNQTRRWGYFDDNDGLFYELSGTTLQIVRRTSTSGSVVNNTTTQASWNQDKLDGTGYSGVTLDITKGNIYEIHFQWLGVGIVRFYINGILVHEMLNQNTLSTVYMKAPQLPLSWEVVNTGASTASSMDAICANVSSEGGGDIPSYSFSAGNSADLTVNTTERPVLSIRPKTTYNSVGNRMLLIPKLISIRTEGARIGWRITMNSTLTGASFSSVLSTSGTEFDIAATALSGGDQLYLGFLANTNDSFTLYTEDIFSLLGRKMRISAFSSVQDILTISAVNEAAGNTNVRASITWEEVR